MRRSGLVVFAWLVALMLVVSPVLPAGMSQGASAQTETEVPGGELPPVDGTPTGEPTPDPSATATEPAPSETPTGEPTVDPSATPEVPVTQTATEPATEEPVATEATSTSTPESDLFGAAELGDIVITLKCTTDPESIRVTNTGAGDISLTSIGTIKDLVGSEPWPLDRTLKPGGTAIFQAGRGAQYGTVLTTSFILTNSAYEEEGVLVATSEGVAEARCAPKPPPPPEPTVLPSEIKVELSCMSYAETIRVTNNGRGSITIKGFASYIDVTPEEPIAIAHRNLKPGQTAIYQAGTGAKYGTILTKSYIFTNAAYERDGIRISTSIGKLSKACAPKPLPTGERWIEVNLSTQYLIAWVGNTRVNETYVSTGKPGFETPTGTFRILTRYWTQTMSGCIQGECYYVPDVPKVQYFTNFGHALHGAYWHNDFGRTRSHGCVNLPLAFADWLWYWATYGTRIWIHY